MEQKNNWELYETEELNEIETLSERYRHFLTNGKTERECTAYVSDWALRNGFTTLEERIASGAPLKAGERIISSHMGKTAALFIIGKKPLEEGINYIGAHIDSPRIDIKQNPVYEDGEMAYLDTHYYGGIKKYQWITMPLALHGVAVLKDGTVKNIIIGESEDDPVLCITDLLIHLSQEHMEKTASRVVDGENLDILIGSRPLKGAEKEPVKAGILKYLKEQYGIEEEDFISAELEAVPAGAARDCGLDRSMIMGYGHDDRSCAFPALYAMEKMAAENTIPDKTCVAFFTDKEEVGSIGATGSHSHFFENTMAELCALDGGTCMLELKIRRCLQHSCVLSADVSSAFDPLFASAFARNNTSRLGHGIAIVKYTGSRGKGGANDANAEYLAKIRNIFEQGQVHYQTAEIGRVDLGGGGTIAYIVAAYGGEVVDCGVPVLSMHAPWEIISKADLYEAYKAYLTFYTMM